MKGKKKRLRMSEPEEKIPVDQEKTGGQEEQISESGLNDNQCPDAVLETMDSLQQKVNEWQDKYTRLYAEFENFRKRSRQELFELRVSGGDEVILSILPVLDDFERGLASLEAATDIDAVKQGYELIYSKLSSILKQKGLEAVDAMHQEFDTDFHEAITMVSNEALKGKVVDVVEKGYTIRGKVLRFARVVVGQ